MSSLFPSPDASQTPAGGGGRGRYVFEKARRVVQRSPDDSLGLTTEGTWTNGGSGRSRTSTVNEEERDGDRDRERDEGSGERVEQIELGESKPPVEGKTTRRWRVESIIEERKDERRRSQTLGIGEVGEKSDGSGERVGQAV